VVCYAHGNKEAKSFFFFALRPERPGKFIPREVEKTDKISLKKLSLVPGEHENQRGNDVNRIVPQENYPSKNIPQTLQTKGECPC